MDELERVERELWAALSRGELDAASSLLHEDFVITTAGWIAEPVAKQAWLNSRADQMTFDSFDLRVGRS